MKLGYTIIYVKNVGQALSFFENAFLLQRKFFHESGDYGELQTGDTTLAFASRALALANFPEGVVFPEASNLPLGIEIAFVSDDVHTAYQHALNAGATPVTAPKLQPWGQVVSYVRCPDGVLVELCSPVG